MKNGFSTVQIIIAFGVIVALITMSIFGLNIAQRSSRDSSRKSTAGDIAIKINDYRRANLSYPAQLNFNGNRATIDNQVIKDLNGFLSSDNNTTSSSTSYYYERTQNGGYALCVELETGSIESFGTIDCSFTSFGGSTPDFE